MLCIHFQSPKYAMELLKALKPKIRRHETGSLLLKVTDPNGFISRKANNGLSATVLLYSYPVQGKQ